MALERVRSSRRLTALEQPALLPKHNIPPPPLPSNNPRLHPSPPRRRGTSALVGGFIILVIIHFASTALTSGEPLVDPPGVAWADLQLDGDASAALAALYPPAEPLPGPSLIPRIIHHLYNSSEGSAHVAEGSYMRWRGSNPGWELRFYDEDDSGGYVGRWFPQYVPVYNKLRSVAERRDLFRYLAVLRHGGLFADERAAPSLQPLDDVVRQDDAMVAAWDAEFPSGQAAISACYIRARQLQHRLFAAAPGHPALREAVERIAATLNTRFSLHPEIDAQERTGPGVFTDALLQHARKHPPTLRGAADHWSVRLLPRKAFGEVQDEVCDQPWDSSSSSSSSISSGSSGGDESSLLSSLSSTSIVSSSSSSSSSTAQLGTLRGASLRELSENEQAAVDKQQRQRQPSKARRFARWWMRWVWKRGAGGDSDSSIDGDDGWGADSHRPDIAIAAHLERVASAHEDQQLFPVSADFEPPFDVMTHLVSHGERQSGWDVSQVLSAYGTWQPSVQPTRRPSLAEAVVGSLGVLQQDSHFNSMMMMMGGGGGGVNSSSSSRSSLFMEEDPATSSSSVGVQSESEGMQMVDGGVLVDIGAGYGVISLAAAARGHRVHAFELGPGSLRALEASIERNGFDSLVQVHKVPLGTSSQRGQTCLELVSGAAAAAVTTTTIGALGVPSLPPNVVELARGYSDPAAHAVLDSSLCSRSTLRLPGVEALPRKERVGALRVSANGWEGFILEGFLPLLQRQRPPVIAVEWNPIAMKAVGYHSPLQLLRMLSSLGYDDISHSGFICDERWYSVTYGVRRRGGQRPEDQASLRQPTWCRLMPEDHDLILDKANSKYPETLLFINRASGARSGGGRSAAAAAAAAAPGPGQTVTRQPS